MYRANPNKSLIKILEKRERGHIQGLRKFFVYPLLSQERVKLRTSNFVGTFIGSTGTKAHENIENSGHGRSQGVPKIFRAPICRAHCAVIFAIAQPSCWLIHPCDDRKTDRIVIAYSALNIMQSHTKNHTGIVWKRTKLHHDYFTDK